MVVLHFLAVPESYTMLVESKFQVCKIFLCSIGNNFTPLTSWTTGTCGAPFQSLIVRWFFWLFGWFPQKMWWQRLTPFILSLFIIQWTSFVQLKYFELWPGWAADFSCSKWRSDEQGGLVRDVSFLHPIKFYLGMSRVFF